jgi:hypothetical protein
MSKKNQIIPSKQKKFFEKKLCFVRDQLYDVSIGDKYVLRKILGFKKYHFNNFYQDVYDSFCRNIENGNYSEAYKECKKLSPKMSILIRHLGEIKNPIISNRLDVFYELVMLHYNTHEKLMHKIIWRHINRSGYNHYEHDEMKQTAYFALLTTSCLYDAKWNFTTLLHQNVDKFLKGRLHNKKIEPNEIDISTVRGNNHINDHNEFQFNDMYHIIKQEFYKSFDSENHEKYLNVLDCLCSGITPQKIYELYNIDVKTINKIKKKIVRQFKTNPVLKNIANDMREAVYDYKQTEVYSIASNSIENENDE